jgi:hypothetical protein
LVKNCNEKDPKFHKIAEIQPLLSTFKQGKVLHPVEHNSSSLGAEFTEKTSCRNTESAERWRENQGTIYPSSQYCEEVICHHVGGMEEVNALEDIIIQRFGYSLSCNHTFGYQLWEILPVIARMSCAAKTTGVCRDTEVSSCA